MEREWIEGSFDRQTARRAGLHVTMSQDYEIYMNAGVIDALGSPTHYLLLYDRRNHALGIRPVNSSTPKAVHAAKRGRGGGRSLRAFRICKEFGIKFETKVRFLMPRVENGVLVLDLAYTDTKTRAWPRS